MLARYMWACAFATLAFGQGESLDPAFDKIPFGRWLAEGGEQAPMRWTLSASRPDLTFHQRLVTRIEIKLDGRDLAPRVGQGRLMIFLQLTAGTVRYQDHGSIDLAKLETNIKSADVSYTQSAFVLPGEYQLAVAILDTTNGQHSVRQETVRIPSPKNEFLVAGWKGLPPVEFTGDEDPPDSWFLPRVHGHWDWAKRGGGPAHIHVVVNVAVAPEARRSRSPNLGPLIATLKSISQSGSEAVKVDAKWLDLSRRKVVYQQDGGRELDWPAMKESLSDSGSGTIDVKALSQRFQDAQFFVREVGKVLRRAEGAEGACAVVVLTNPVAFEPGEDLHPISLESKTGCKVFYIRYVAPPPIRPMAGPGFGGSYGYPGARRRLESRFDQLEGTLKPLKPRVFDVETPEQMTRALAEIAAAL